MGRYRWRGSGTLSLGLVGLLAATAPAWAGMAELGRTSPTADTAAGDGTVTLRFNPQAMHSPMSGDSASTVLTALAGQIGGGFTANVVPPNTIEINRVQSARELTLLDLANTDSGFQQGIVSLPRCPLRRCEALIFIPNAPAGDGDVTVTIGGTTVMVSTAGLTASDLLDSLVTALTAAGFDASRSGDAVVIKGARDILWDDLDTGITSWRIAVRLQGDIPTLSTWGVLLLVATLGAAAMLLMRRRAAMTGA